jgi:hypothetical protein
MGKRSDITKRSGGPTVIKSNAELDAPGVPDGWGRITTHRRPPYVHRAAAVAGTSPNLNNLTD